MRAISAAGAPLARIAAMGDGGGPAGPPAWVASEVSFATLGGAEPPETGDVPESTGGATGPGVQADDTAAEAEAAGCAASELAEPESTTAREAVLDSATGTGGGATAAAGSTAAGGGCTTAGAGAGSTTGGAGQRPVRVRAPTGTGRLDRHGRWIDTGAGAGSIGRAARRRLIDDRWIDDRYGCGLDRHGRLIDHRCGRGLEHTGGGIQHRRERGVNRCRRRINRRGGGRIRRQR